MSAPDAGKMAGKHGSYRPELLSQPKGQLGAPMWSWGKGSGGAGEGELLQKSSLGGALQALGGALEVNVWFRTQLWVLLRPSRELGVCVLCLLFPL